MTRINNDQTKTFEAGEFYFEQRNAGFVDNDGRWILSLLPELYWDKHGFLRQRRAGKLIGVFDTLEDAVNVATSVDKMPEDDQMVRSMGCVSC